MNDFEKQVLTNQLDIIVTLREITNNDNCKKLLLDRYDETRDILNPIVEPTLKEKTFDALCEDSEVKK